jgi:hypothetical protein
MRTGYLTLFVLLFCVHARAQRTFTYSDTLFTTSGELIFGRICFMAKDTVYYNYYTADRNIESTKIARADVDHIGVSPGRATILNEEETDINKRPVSLGEKYAMKGRKDAQKYYDGYTSAGTWTLIVGLISPLAGLVPAIATSVVTPKDRNLDIPSAELMKNPDYRTGYVTKAKRKKQGKVWLNWGIAFGANLIAVVLLQSSSGN